jgi:hypothetical protein
MTLLTYTIVTLKFYKMVSNQRWTSRHRQNFDRKIVLHSPALIQHAKHNTVLLIRIECQLSSVSVTENQFTDNISFTGCSDEHMDSCWFHSQKPLFSHFFGWILELFRQSVFFSFSFFFKQKGNYKGHDTFGNEINMSPYAHPSTPWMIYYL